MIKNLSAEKMRDYAYSASETVSEDILAKYGFDGDLLKIYAENKGRGVHKWHHYIPLYDRYFAEFRNRPVKFLEIGVYLGGSLQMWRKYLGESAILYGIDIDPDCAAANGEAGQVRIGSQDDPEFLNKVIDEMGGVDVILDDGSHHMDHIQTSLEVLFPRLNTGGVYMIEDLHTAYWHKYGGGFGQKANFFNTVRDLIDDMHMWYHDRDEHFPGLGNAVSGLHIHDSIVVLEKGPVHQPVHSVVR